MKIPPKYTLNNNILNSISIIESNRGTIDAVDLPIAVEQNLRRKAILGSSLFSARIEGNTLKREDVSDLRDITSKEKQKLEVANLFKTINFVLAKFDKNKLIKESDILSWHKILNFEGKWRTEHEGIFDAAGNAVYHAPPPSHIPGLISDLAAYINKDTDENPLIKAVLTHLLFEKIHPFVDGNGRVGRLLQLAVLSINGYGMNGMVVTEEIIDKKRQLYYQAISDSVGDNATEFVETMLEFMVEATSVAKDKMLAGKKFTQTDMLPLRRQELLQIIRDHRTVTLDFLHRRFLNVDDRLLRYDLKQLIDLGFVTKIGKTKGVIYTPKEN